MSKLQKKFIILLVIFSSLLVFLNLMVAHWSFSRGFQSYIEQQRVELLERIADNLSESYRSPKHWNMLTTQTHEWKKWLRRQLGAQLVLERHRQKNSDFAYDEDEHHNGSRKHQPRRFHNTLVRRVNLLDAEKNLLQGVYKANKTYRYIPVTVDNKTVAYLAFHSDPGRLNQVDQLFIARQLDVTWLMLCLAVVLSVLFAYLLAKWLLRPVLNISHTVRGLASNDLTQRADVRSRDELGQLAQDVNQLAITLHEQQLSQQRWMIDIAHELRTPLAVLKAQLEAIEDGVRDFDAVQLRLIRKETDYIQSLVEDMRELISSERSGLNYAWAQLEVSEFIHQQVPSWQQTLQHVGLVFELSITGTKRIIQADEDRLNQLFHNLLQNSLRYTQTPGEVKLACRFESERVYFVWEDSAPSVADTSLDKLFNRLYRDDVARSRFSGGSGIGLSICRNIVAAHQGEIIAKHSTLGGLAIEFFLPYNI